MIILLKSLTDKKAILGNRKRDMLCMMMLT